MVVRTLISSSLNLLLCNYEILTAISGPLKVLSGHTSVVKGIVWDPIGTFLATQVRYLTALLDLVQLPLHTKAFEMM